MGERTLKRSWRLLSTGPGDGAWNMALDQALLDAVRAGGAPFLRFYTWNPAALSLGRFQNLSDGLYPDLDVPVVRRPTGGGGIWHADELTYSLACTQDDLGLTGVKASFERLSGFLLDTWTELGWDAHFAKDTGRGSLGTYTPACFAGSEEYDVLVGGRKLGGNAQRRDRNVIFQHGSIPGVLDHGALSRIFLPEARPEPSSVTDLRSCGWRGTDGELIGLLTSAFSVRLEAEVRADSPTSAQLSQARFLASSRFSDPAWTRDGGGSLRGSPQ